MRLSTGFLNISPICAIPCAFPHIAFIAQDLQIIQIKPQIPSFSQWLNVIDHDTHLIAGNVDAVFCCAAALATSAMLFKRLHPQCSPVPRFVKGFFAWNVWPIASAWKRCNRNQKCSLGYYRPLSRWSRGRKFWLVLSNPRRNKSFHFDSTGGIWNFQFCNEGFCYFLGLQNWGFLPKHLSINGSEIFSPRCPFCCFTHYL